MRICLVNPTVLIRRPISELAAVLRDEGHEVGILTPRGRSGLHHEKYLQGVRIHRYDSWQPPGSFEWPVPRGFSRLVRQLEEEYDVFHAWTHFYLSSLLLAIRKPSKLVVTLDTVPGESFSLGWLDALFWVYNRTIGRWILNRADAVSVYSELLVPYLERVGYSHEPFVTPTGVLEPEVSKKPGLPDDFVLFVGLPGRRKGIDRVLEVAQQLPETMFLVAGESPERATWDRRSPSNVEFLGKVDYVPALMSRARCLLLPSRGEGLPGVVMEAMALRCPVVASSIPCIPDLVRDGKEGLLVDGDDIGGYVEAIERLSEKKLAKKLSSAAYERVQERFLWEKASKGFVEMYEEVR